MLKLRFIPFKVAGDGIFSAVAKRRITHIVAKAGGGNYIMQLVAVKLRGVCGNILAVIFYNKFTGQCTETPPD